MDLISLYYFSELAKDLHITRTAERLFISQQTLSNHIHRMEEELGTPLLKRKPSLRLTLAGELTLSFARSVTQNYGHLRDALSDIEGQERGALRFGGSAVRLNACLPEILPKYTERYPNVELRVTDAISSKLEPLVLDGQLDFAIVLSGTEDPRLDSKHLIHDQLYLCMADSLLKKYYGVEAESLKQKALNGAFVQDFERLPFCMMSNRMGQILQGCFNDAGLIPRVYSRSTYTRIGLAMCERGQAACVASQMNLLGQRRELAPDINVFPLRGREGLLFLPLSLIQLADRTMPLYAKYFLELLMQYFFQMEQKSLGRIGCGQSESACMIGAENG